MRACKPHNLRFRQIYKYEMNYFNACGYWLGLQKTWFGMLNPTQAMRRRRHLCGESCCCKLGRKSLKNTPFAPSLSVRGSTATLSKDRVAARLNRQMYEEDAYLPVSEALDDRTRQLGKCNRRNS